MADNKVRLKLQNEAFKEYLSHSKHRLKKSDILVFIPVHNEEITIEKVIKKVQTSCDFDILVVDDGSTDATNSIVKQMGIEILKHPRCLGSMVLLSGLMAAKSFNYKFIVKIDGDDQHDAKDIPKLYAHAVKTNADVVTGSRHFKKYAGNLFSVQGLGMWFCSGVVSVMARRRITDVTSGLKIWNSKAVETLIQAFNKGLFDEDSTILIEETLIEAKKRLIIEEIPVVMYPREYGESKSYSKKKMMMFPWNLIRSLARVTVSR